MGIAKNFCAVAAAMWLAGVVCAGEAQPVVADAALEARVMRLAEELRCLVCQNQTIADSHAPLALDLKNQVREMMSAGKSDADVVSYMAQRYGDFVLYRPPLKGTTLLLWLAPALLGGGALFFVLRRIRALESEGAPPILDAISARRADALLGLPGERDPT